MTSMALGQKGVKGLPPSPLGIMTNTKSGGTR
jgi:hypothetical protein